MILKQLTSSIPEKEYKMIYDWKVTQACITKVAQQSQSREQHTTLNMNITNTRTVLSCLCATRVRITSLCGPMNW